MEKLLPEYHSFERGKIKISFKVIKSPQVLQWWKELQYMKKGTGFMVLLRLLVITGFEVSSKLFFVSKIDLAYFDFCVCYRYEELS